MSGLGDLGKLLPKLVLLAVGTGAAAEFARLGLGTVADGLWRDPQHSVRAAAQLVRLNMAAAPASGLLDHFSLYNAGVSDQGPRPKLTADGLYIDGLYVWTGFLWYVAIVLSGLAPFGIKQQTTTTT